jgi:Tfp pilus assembly protein PilV
VHLAKKSASRAGSRGMILIEVLISMVIMTVMVLSVVGLVLYSFNELQVNSAQIQAVAVGQHYNVTTNGGGSATFDYNPVQSTVTLPNPNFVALSQWEC